VGAIAFPTDGQRLVTASGAGELCYWDLRKDRETRRVSLPGLQALSPDGKAGVTAGVAFVGNSDEGGFRVWDLAARKVRYRFASNSDPPLAAVEAAFSADGNLLATCARDGREVAVRLWDLRAGKELRRWPVARATPYGFTATGLGFSPDGKVLVARTWRTDRNTGQRGCRMRAWQTTTGELAWVADAPGSFYPALAFAPDGKVLATGDPDGVVLRETATGTELLRLPVPRPVTALAFSPDGRALAGAPAWTLAEPPAVHVWELATGGLGYRFTGHRGGVTCLRYSGDGAVLASGSYDTTVLLWDQTGRFLAANHPPRKAAQRWADLGSSDAKQGFRAMGELAASPAAALKLFKARLRPARGKAPGRKEIAKFLADLNDPKFPVREAARRSLERAGPVAVPALRERLRGTIPAEVRRRIERLLARLDAVTVPPEDLRGVRAVAVLERIGTPEARRLLEALAGGAPEARLTGEARAALLRLAARPAGAP
jgi:hypothetical protein